MLWDDGGSFLLKSYYSALAQFKALKKRFDKDSGLKSKYTETKCNSLKKDLDKVYVIPI